MHPIGRSLSLCALAALLAAPALCGVRVGRQKVVYLLDFEQESPLDDDLGHFATTLVKLRLAQLTFIRVVHQKEEALCRVKETFSPQMVRQVRKETALGDESQPVDDRARPAQKTITEGEASYRPAYFTVRGSLKVRAAEVFLHYDLLKTVDCQTTLLINSSTRFPEVAIFQNLTLMANVLASTLQKEAVERIMVDVSRLDVKGGAKEKEISNELTDFILYRLGEMNAFQPRDLRRRKTEPPAEFRLGGRLKFGRNLKPWELVRGFPKSAVEAHLYVETRGTKRYKLPVVRSSINKITEFYLTAADAAIKGLNDVRYARAAGLEKDLRLLQVEALLDKGRELTCEEETEPSCSPDAEAAVALLSELTKKDKRNKEGFRLLGMAHLQARNYLDAGQAFDQALELTGESKPGRAIWLLNQAGNAWYEAKNYSKAAERYERSLQLTAKHKEALPGPLQLQPDTHLRRARSLRFAGQRLAALDALAHSLDVMSSVGEPAELKDELRDVIENLNQELEEVIESLHGEELEQAVRRLEVSVGPKHRHVATTLKKLATFYFNRRRYDDALASLDQALSIDPQDSWAYNERGRVYFDQGKYMLSIADFDATVKYDPKHKWAYANKGSALRRLARFDEALAALDQAIQIDTRYAWAYNLRGIVHLDQHNNDEAMKNFDKAIDSDPTNEEAYGNKALVLRRLGRFDEAVAALDQAVEVDPGFAWAYGLRGVILHDHLFDREAAYEAAYRDLRNAHELEPNNLSFRTNFIESNLTSGRFEVAYNLATNILAEVDSASESKLSAGQGLAMRFVATCSLILKGETQQARKAMSELVKYYGDVPDGDQPSWSYSGTRHFIQMREMDAASRNLVLTLLDVLESKKSEGKMKELEQITSRTTMGKESEGFDRTARRQHLAPQQVAV